MSSMKRCIARRYGWLLAVISLIGPAAGIVIANLLPDLKSQLVVAIAGALVAFSLLLALLIRVGRLNFRGPLLVTSLFLPGIAAVVAVAIYFQVQPPVAARWAGIVGAVLAVCVWLLFPLFLQDLTRPRTAYPSSVSTLPIKYPIVAAGATAEKLLHWRPATEQDHRLSATAIVRASFAYRGGGGSRLRSSRRADSPRAGAVCPASSFLDTLGRK
jgi:hypothetical protein